MDRNGRLGSAIALSGRLRRGYIAGGPVRNEKWIGMVNWRISSERREGGESNRDPTGAGRRRPLPYQPIDEGFIGVGVRMKKTAQALASGCQSESIFCRLGRAGNVLLSPNPPKDTDGRREDSGRWVRDLQGR